MKINIEFDLNREEDRETYQHTFNASAMYYALSDINAELRRIHKYVELSEDEANKFERLVDKFSEILSDRGLNIGEM